MGKDRLVGTETIDEPAIVDDKYAGKTIAGVELHDKIRISEQAYRQVREGIRKLEAGERQGAKVPAGNSDPPAQ